MSREPHDAQGAAAQKNEPIAIVGMGLRLPGGSNSPDEFDAFLRTGQSGIGPIPADRWDVEALHASAPDDKGKITTGSGGFLDRIDLFDAPFFNISPKEARYIDPQQRMVLETAWQALEHAGIDPTPLRQRNGGVYMGVSSFDYGLHMGALPYEDLDGHLAAGSPIFAIAGRVSYFLGWRGPSLCVDSACSSSLSALHLAVQGLRSGECEIALCGGVNAVHHPSFMVMFSHGQMLAADGQCKTFDESADGYSRAEGCGVVVLKRLSDAERDGDTVIALIRGTAIGQDGDSAGLTVPHGPAQELTIRKALAAASLTPADIQYVEAHGTGTPLGDPIELGAISNVFAQSHSKDTPLLVGSVKTNIGHMEPASGIVGVIKTALQLRSSTIFPHLNFTEPSRRIPWDAYPVKVPTQCLPWTAPTRRAVVNSFGFAGTIAATVLEQAPAPRALPTPVDVPPAVNVFTLSGKNAAGLRRQAESYRQFLDANPDLNIERMCYTSNVGRAHFTHRRASVIKNRADLIKLLDTAAAPGAGSAPAGIRKVAFLFSGQGTQYAGMGAALYERFAVFRQHVDECDQLFATHLPVSVRSLILGQTDEPELLDQTGYTQPALLTFEYALAQLWMSWGIKPSVLIGHSIGEVAAAAVAGLFSLHDAVTLVAARARLMQSVRQAGGMAAVSLPEDDVQALLGNRPDLALAAVNAPDQCVVSGAADALAELTGELRERGIRVDALVVSHAFHSPLMAEVYDEYRAAIATVEFHAPEIPLISNTTGAVGKFTELGTPDYWVRHIGEPVRFMAGVQAVEHRGRHAFVEIGPSTALTALAQRCVAAEDHRWIASARRRDPSGETVLRGLADLYGAGVTVSWPGVHAAYTLAKVQLPTYAFERKRYWLPVSAKTSGIAASGISWHPLLGRPVPAAEGDPAGTRRFTAQYTASQPELLAGHTTDDGAVVAPAAFVEILLALQDAVHGATDRTIRDLTLVQPLLLPEETTVEIRTRLLPLGDGGSQVEIVSGPAAEEKIHATAFLAASEDNTGPDMELAARADAPGVVTESATADDVYTDFASVGRRYGSRYRLLAQVSRHDNGIVTGELIGREASAAEHLPVELLECALQAVVALDEDSPAFAPVTFGSVQLFRKPRGQRLRVAARVTAPTSGERRADLLLLDGDLLVAEARDVILAQPGRADERPEFLHRLSWVRHRATPDTATVPRHVLVLGGDPGRLAAAAPTAQVTRVDGTGALSIALKDPSVTDICWFWQPHDGPMSASRVRAEAERNYQDLLAVVAALNAAGPTTAPRLWLVTERAQWLPGDRPGTGEQLAAATLWGFGHVLLNEYPRYRTTLLDLPVNADLTVLAEEWQAQDTGDFQIAYRHGQRHVRRLLAGATTPAWEGPFELRVPLNGDLADVGPVAADDHAPGPGEVQLLVHAAAARHRDVRSPVDGTAPPILGSGCSGTVVAVGTGSPFAVGDRVIAYQQGSLRRTVTVPVAAVALAPHDADLTEAAALPHAYVTAHQAMRHLEGADSGATVLVHVSGGTGQALAALATRAGYQVITTADAEQRPTLAVLGVGRVLDPNADLATEVLQWTDGRGVDVVFDGPGGRWSAIDHRCLAEGGRRISLTACDDADSAGPTALAGGPGPSVGEILASASAALRAGELPPLRTTAFSLDEAGEAFITDRDGTTAQPVVTLAAAAPEHPNDRPDLPVTVVRPDRSYLISGGFGGLGLVTAAKLVDLGARHLILVSRSGRPTPEAAPVLEALAQRCDITVAQTDLADAADMARLFTRVRSGRVPLGGIVHAAGSAGSSLIGNLTWSAIDEQLRAQAYGGWLLHEASLDCPDLDFFVVHSSIAAVVGGSTQAHYAAAFAFLDGLTAWRTRQGLASQATNWGMWSRVGMSARLDENLARELERGGLRFFSPARALRLMHRLLSTPAAQYVAGQWDWRRYVSTNPLQNALYSRLPTDRDSTPAGNDTTGGPAFDVAALRGKPRPERLAAVGEVVLARVADALHAEEGEEIEATTEFVALGLDSLMALELKVGLEAAFGVALPASLAFDYPSPQLLLEFIDAQLVPVAG